MPQPDTAAAAAAPAGTYASDKPPKGWIKARCLGDQKRRDLERPVFD